MAATLIERLPRGMGIGRAGLLLLLGVLGTPTAHAVDPTQPPEHLLRNLSPAAGGAAHGATAAPLAPIVLQAILHADGRPSRVMVDGWLYRAGDTVQGRRLVAIGRHSADFEAQGRRQTIALVPQAGITRLRVADADAGTSPTTALAPVRNKPARTRARRPNKENP